MNSKTDELTLTKSALAQTLGVSKRTVERLRAGGFLPASIPGLKHPRWAREAVLAWLRESGKGRSK